MVFILGTWGYIPTRTTKKSHNHTHTQRERHGQACPNPLSPQDTNTTSPEAPQPRPSLRPAHPSSSISRHAAPAGVARSAAHPLSGRACAGPNSRAITSHPPPPHQREARDDRKTRADALFAPALRRTGFGPARLPGSYRRAVIRAAGHVPPSGTSPSEAARARLIGHESICAGRCGWGRSVPQRAPADSRLSRLKSSQEPRDQGVLVG